MDFFKPRSKEKDLEMEIRKLIQENETLQSRNSQLEKDNAFYRSKLAELPEKVFRTLTFQYETWRDKKNPDIRIELPVSLDYTDIIQSRPLNYEAEQVQTFRIMAGRLAECGYIPTQTVIGSRFSFSTHDGVEAFRKKYLSFADFVNHFPEDFQKEEEKEIRDNGGWVICLNYDTITVEFINPEEDSKFRLEITTSGETKCFILISKDAPNLSAREIFSIKDALERKT